MKKKHVEIGLLETAFLSVLSFRSAHADLNDKTEIKDIPFKNVQL